MLIVLHCLAGIFLVATLLPLTRFKAWWVRAMDFPRTQIAGAAALILIGYALNISALDGLNWAGPLSMAGVIIFQAWWILPFTPLWRREAAVAPVAEAADVVRIMIANILMTNRNAAGVKAMVSRCKPDIFLAVEVDAWWDRQLSEIAEQYPHIVARPLDNLYGMTLYSRWPLEDAEVKYLVEPGRPSIHARVILPNGKRIRLICVHPSPPAPGESDDSVERDAELIVVARSVANDPEPTIVTGDLNDVAWSRTTRLFRKISHLLDPRVGRGLYNTFHAKWPLVRWPVDHLFHSRHFTVASLKRMPACGSDHFPICAELVFGGEQRNGEGLEADAEDYQEAREEVAMADRVRRP